MATIGFLHTAQAHVATFRALVADIAPGTRDVHAVDTALLADAQRSGVTGGLRERIGEHLRALALEADVVVCTCSTIAGEAELLGAALATPVMRLDRPMAEAAMRGGRRVTVVAAVAATLEPTRALLVQCAPGPGSEIVLAPCPDAWALFERGDADGYRARVAQHVRALAAGTDVVVLAQASMGGVEALVADLGVLVVSSPRLGVAAAARLAAGAR
jgi:hypothetical protein